MGKIKTEEFEAYGRLGYTGRRLGRQKSFWSNLQSQDGFYLIDQGEKDQFVDSIKVVKEASDLAGTLDSSKVYVIDGIIDMGSQSITVPQSGLTMQGYGTNISILYSSEDNYTMFIDDGVYSGDFFADSITFDVTGTNSKMFDLNNAENNNAFEFEKVNFGQFANGNTTSLGEITDYRQILFTNVAFIKVSDGIDFSGTWSGGFAATDTITLAQPAGSILFKEGTSLSFQGSVRSNMNALSIDDTAAVFGFSESNFVEDGAFALSSYRASQTSNSVPNIDSSSVKAFFKDCSGVLNTYPGGDWTIETGATTTIPSSGTLVKMAGTTSASNLTWWSQTDNNEMTYLSDIDVEIVVSGILSFSGTANREMAVQIRQWDDSASSYVNIGPEFKATLNGGAAGTRAENLAFKGTTTVSVNDRIEIWIKNITDDNDITSTAGGVVSVQERAP